MIYKSQHSNAGSFARFFPRQSKGVGITFWAVPSRSKPFDSIKKRKPEPPTEARLYRKMIKIQGA